MHSLHRVRALIEPKSTDDDGRRREFILNVLLASSTMLSLAALLILVFQFASLGSRYTGEPLLVAILPVVLFTGLWVLSRKGYFIVSAYLLVAIFLLLAFYVLFTWGILLPQGVLLLALVLVMASILLGTSIGAAVTLLASVVLILLGWLQQAGTLAFDSSWMKTTGGPADAIGFALTLAVITTVSWLSNREIERFNSTLQDKVDHATARLRTANKNLKVLDKAKDEFISMASHQLGTPLTAIEGYLSMTLDKDKHTMTTEQREFVKYALEASERMGGMSRDLLNASRLNAGKFTIHREPVDLAAMVKGEVESLQPAAKRKGLKVELISSPVPILNVDPSKTRQVVMNFIDNAIYYTQQGSIQVTLERHLGAVVLTVADTGIGVPDNEKSKLFAKFYRAKNATAARPDGTGLGIYLAKRVIEDQGGAIIFKSAENKGSTFGFSLPIDTPPV
ncbi:MAG: putative Histidine kinase [Patescibacteria group bacterium]|nr:putative Histidine kinase [Patescibacteria group bacterium]